MTWFLKGIPVVVMLATSAVAAFSGIALVGYGFAFSGSGAGIGAVAFGIALLVSAAVIAVVVIGLWRGRAWAVHVGLAVLAVELVVAGLFARTAFQPRDFIADSTGQLQPHYDSGAMAIALSILPLGIALACLAVAELRLRQHAGDRSK